MDEETYLQKLEAKHQSYNTINQYLRLYRLHRSDWASQEGVDKYCSLVLHKKNYNPLYIGALKSYIFHAKLEKEIVVPKPSSEYLRTRKKELVYLSKDEIDQIIRDTTQWVSILTRVYFDTGLRLNELINITRDKIDLENRTIIGLGKRNKPFKVKFSPNTAMKLSIYMKLKTGEYIFKEYDNSTKDYGRSYWYHLKKESGAMGFKGVHPHSIRHSLGRYLLRVKKLDIMEVKTKLRHSDVKSTQIYTEATQEEVDKKIDEEVFNDEGNDNATEHSIQ